MTWKNGATSVALRFWKWGAESSMEPRNFSEHDESTATGVCRTQALEAVSHVSPPASPAPAGLGPLPLDSAIWRGLPSSLPNTLSLKGHRNDQRWSKLHCDNYTPPEAGCPQFQLPHSGSINYYSNRFSQPTDSKLTACSSVLLHGTERDREREELMD
jgi:hypothetical protein